MKRTKEDSFVVESSACRSSDPDSLRGISAEIPPLPPSSPWASDPVPDEPLIDRSDDGDEMGVEIDQLNR